MIKTINDLFNNPLIISAIIDRVMQTRQDTIFWERYLSFQQTTSRTFKTYFGTTTGVTAGSVIDRNSNKPLRQRKELGSGIGEVAYLGDRYQMDNDRLDRLQELINKYNSVAANSQASVIGDIVNFLYDDMRQVLLAPHKRMDLMVGQLRSDGHASVKNSNNPLGIEMVDITLPVQRITPMVGDKANFITYLQTTLSSLRSKYGQFATMEMTRATFVKAILGSDEFKNTYKMILGNAEFATAGGLITDAMANQVFTGIGLPGIRIVEDYVDLEDGSSVNTFADQRITLLRSDNLGTMKWHTPYEITDPVPGKTYTQSVGGMYISNQRTDEGRFLEYGAEWIPDFRSPDKLIIMDLSTMIP